MSYDNQVQNFVLSFLFSAYVTPDWCSTRCMLHMHAQPEVVVD